MHDLLLMDCRWLSNITLLYVALLRLLGGVPAMFFEQNSLGKFFFIFFLSFLFFSFFSFCDYQVADGQVPWAPQTTPLRLRQSQSSPFR